MPVTRDVWAGRHAHIPGDPEPSLAPLDLKQLFATLRRRIWLVLGVTVLVTGAATYLAVSALPEYQATATVRLTDTRRQLTGGLADAPDAKALITADVITSQIAVLTSRVVVGKLVDSMPTLRARAAGFPRELVGDIAITSASADSLGFPTVVLTFGEHEVTAMAGEGRYATAPYGAPIDFGDVKFVIASRPKAGSGKLTILGRDDAAAALAGAVKARAREGSSVIDVSYASSDPALAQRVVNELAHVFREASIQDAAKQARLRRQFIETQLRQNDSLLTSARFALSGFRSRERAYSVREKFTAERGDLVGLQLKLEEIDGQRRLYTSILQRLQDGQGRENQQQLGALLAAQGATASPIITDLYTQLQRLEQRRDSLTMGRWASAPTNPDVQRIDALVAATRNRLQQTVQGIIVTLDGRRAELARISAQNAAKLAEIPVTDMDEARLTEREVAYQKSADQLRGELQRARLAEAAEVGQVEIVDLARPPRAPVGMPANRKIAFGLLLGLFFGSGCALVLEHLNTSIRGRDELEATLRLPGLAVIPQSTAKKWRAQKAVTAGSAKRARGTGVAKAPSEQVSKAIVTVRDVQSPGAEAYRTLRTKLLFSRAAEPLKTIMVTSPFAQDGKSTIAANLAASFAQHGQSVLLIDCDLRRPTQHELFQVSREPGLAELLASDGLLVGAGRRTGVEGLSLITAGMLPPDPAELVGSARLRELLGQLSEAFDVVILDTPPVLPVADASVLASLADGVLLVVRAGTTHRRAAQLAVQQLQDVGARIVGAILNDPDSQVPLYEDYSYASYYAYTAKG